jgi:hypothetical protein
VQVLHIVMTCAWSPTPVVDGRRVALEVQQDDERDVLTIEPLAAGALPVRRPSDESLAPWYEAHHITLHIAELKHLPRED